MWQRAHVCSVRKDRAAVSLRRPACVHHMEKEREGDKALLDADGKGREGISVAPFLVSPPEIFLFRKIIEGVVWLIVSMKSLVICEDPQMVIQN